MENNKNINFEYTMILDGNNGFAEEADEKEEQTSDVQGKNPAEHRAEMDRLYYEYEKMCMKDPTVLDKDDIYPHSYYWRLEDAYDQGKKEVLQEALRTGRRIADTEAYQKYAAAIKNRRFTPVSWD